MDNLTREMMACEEAGFGVSYGKWKASQPLKTLNSNSTVVDDQEKRCERCGKIVIAKRRDARFCSNKCAANARYYRIKEAQKNGKE